MEINETNIIELWYRLKCLSESFNEISIQSIQVKNLGHADELYPLLGALAERLRLDDAGTREINELINKIKLKADSLIKRPSLDDLVYALTSGIEKLPED